MRAAVVTVSTSKAEDPSADESGPRLVAFAESIGAVVTASAVVPDRREEIEASLAGFADDDGCDLILTSGGTGFSPNDVTPEATRAVIDREAPGIAEAIRLASREHTPHWMLSRAVAGIRGTSLIINLPGSPASIDQSGDAIRESLPHALALLRGDPVDHR
jgi:molybdopterin adenylyltransferase